MVSEELVERYRRDGYIVAEGLLPDETIDALRAKIDELAERARGIGQTDEVFELAPGHSAERPLLERIKAPHLQDELFLDLVRHPVIVEVMVALLGPDIRLQNSKLNMKSAGGAAVEWHQDWAFYPHTNDDVLAVGVMIDDMTPENGAVMMVPGSHTGPIYDHHSHGVFCGAVDDKVSANCLERAVQVTGHAGSVTFHHARLLHGSGLNRSGDPRRFLLFEAMAADAWPIAGGAGRFGSWDDMASRMICGRQSNQPRLAPVPVLMPQPAHEVATSIFALQHQGETRLLSKRKEAAT